MKEAKNLNSAVQKTLEKSKSTETRVQEFLKAIQELPHANLDEGESFYEFAASKLSPDDLLAFKKLLEYSSHFAEKKY